MLNKLIAVLAAATMLSTSTFSQVYVDDSQLTMTPDGLSWTTAYPNFQDALLAHSTPQEYRVAEGAYDPTPTGGVPDSTESLVMLEGDRWIGGWKGNETGDTPLGEIDGCTLSGVIASGKNAYNVVKFPEAYSNIPTSIERFHITGGLSDEDTCIEYSKGAGILLGQHANLVEPGAFYGHVLHVRDCQFFYNESYEGGAGIWSYGASELIVDRCQFKLNRVGFAIMTSHTYDGSGGSVGIGLLGGGTSTGFEGSIPHHYGMAFISRCEFERNFGPAGQGVWVGGVSDQIAPSSPGYVEGGECHITNSIFYKNEWFPGFLNPPTGVNIELANNPIPGGGVTGNWMNPAHVEVTNCTIAKTELGWSVVCTDYFYPNDSTAPDGSLDFNNSIGYFMSPVSVGGELGHIAGANGTLTQN